MQKGDPSDSTPLTRATTTTISATIPSTSQIQVLTTLGGQQIGVLPTVSGVTLPTVSLAIPRTVSSQSGTHQLQLSSTRLISPQTINIIQKQLGSSGVVGLSPVSAQGIQQVLQVSGTPLALLTTSPKAAIALDQSKSQDVQQQLLKQKISSSTASSSATIHHLGQPSHAKPSVSNLNQSLSLLTTNMSNLQQSKSLTLKRSLSAQGNLPSLVTTSQTHPLSSSLGSKDLKLFLPGSNQSAILITSSSNASSTGNTDVSPSKKIKLEKKPALNRNIQNLRHSVLSHKRNKIREIRTRYREHLTELFYLQGGGNIVDFHSWRKIPSQNLKNFLEESKLDDEEEEIQVTKINNEVKVLTSSGSNIPLATPVAISTTLPQSVSALNQQAVGSSNTALSSSIGNSCPVSTSSSHLHQHLVKSADVKINGHLKSSSGSQTKGNKSPSHSPGRARQQLNSVYENVTGTQDVIVERAKQEAQVLQRVNELRKEGMWSAKRLPRVQEPPRHKAHWDYLLEEMTWLAADFIQERKWKKAAAKKLARMVANHFKEQEQKELKAEKEEAVKLKKIASNMAKMVKEFWNNIEKVVQYKQTTRLEEKKKKALDLHLSFIVDQTEKYSSWLTAGLQQAEGSQTPSLASDTEVDHADAEFQPGSSGSDDEETIEKEENESGVDEAETKNEVEALHKESDMPLEELLKTLPKEMLEKPSSELILEVDESSSSEDSSPTKQEKKDEDFIGEEESDEEETLEEQENHEKKDYSEELGDLKAEGELSVEELMKKYAGAYDSDFEMPEDETSGNEEDSDDDSSESEKETESSEDEKMDVEENNQPAEGEEKKDMGLEYLVKSEADAVQQAKAKDSNTEGPGKEFNDIAAAAQSLQPKGYTLETTEVKTPIPFLLKHTLREYQHVGLDWLATMHDKRLNGILADEMGLGKTIQTIALLAHLACDKGVWGPHLIVVPTSVMLNWEMEFKKWCPAFKILTYYGSIKERKMKRQGWTKTNAFHVCITSYKLVVQDHQAFRRKKWKYFILDEAQNIKNFKSQRWQMLLNFSSQRRLLLTGTPLQNSLMELWSLMHFLMPNVFQSHSEFKEWFSNPLTGMIEGSQEYNESLVKRLHKVLRPFLLRRLKNEVEKQMPQKFEHVVMCRLSKRQRYLYDDFMSQTKTKDTLASGHFMSVINILMQLRKVCNHPNLFDPRPVVSPFKMEGIVYRTASLVTRALEYDPFRDVNIHSLYPGLAQMEKDLPGFVANRVKQLKAGVPLIEEVDSLPAEPVRPPMGQLKIIKSSAAASSTPTVSTSATKPVQSTLNSIKLLVPSGSSSQQQSIMIQSPSGSTIPIILPLSSAATPSSTSTALAQAKIISSQLQSGLLQLVQTSTGHQVIASNLSVPSTNTPQNTLGTKTSSTTLQKPIMRVSPFVETSAGDATPSTSTSESTSTQPIFIKSKIPERPTLPKKPMQRSELFMESLFRKKEERRKHILSHMAKLNQSRCEQLPVFGKDVHACVNCLTELPSSNAVSQQSRSGEAMNWRNNGFIDCVCAQDSNWSHNKPDTYWRETDALCDAIKSPEQHLNNLQDILTRYVFVTPSVISPNISLHTSHPNHTTDSKLQWLDSQLRPVILDKSALLHPIQSKTLVTFPELRLIQYDCGKLQTLDLLLRQLKSGQHRVLIFTQMTKMLDVLEAFLNFHGHRYLRLDGTTKVEQRQYLMDRFNADPRIFCFILSTRSGGIGVNLTGADTVVFYDSDWNPTMDAQAQDRCHRIGQTRDVHIYRLVSEMTVEENILKKANQKRLLGDLAIEGGNFTTAFFKEQTINDLFAEPSGLDSLVEDKQKEKVRKEEERIAKEKASEEERRKVEEERRKAEEEKEKDQTKKDLSVLKQFEQALCRAEDETDAQAAKQVQAEQKAELAEFDENIPWDEKEAELRKDEDEVSRVEIELAMLDKELTPIERYAVSVIELQIEDETAEELKIAEEDIENSKKDWELARLKALKEEEERRAELEEDEMLYIYSKSESQVFISDMDGSEMPMWCPPTPPQDDNDIYMDETLCFLYEPHHMPESALPPIYVPKLHKKPKLETITTRKQKQRKEEQLRIPRSLFDKPKEVVMKQRRDAKMQRLRQNLQVPASKIVTNRPAVTQQTQQQQTVQTNTTTSTNSTPPATKPEPDPNYPEWLVHEEWSLIEAIQHVQKMNPDLVIDNPAQIVNWDFVSDFVSVVGRIFRASKFCRSHYEYVVLPREDGRIVANVKQQKKLPKSIYKTKSSRPLRTEQLYLQDGLKNYSHLHDIRMSAMMEIGAKRPATMKQTMVNPAAKPTKHAAILAENGITYDQPMLPSALAAKRAERIALDKKKQQQQAQAQANVTSQETTATQRTVQATGVPAQLTSIVSVTQPTAVIASQVPKVVNTNLAVSIARTIGAGQTGNIILSTHAGLQSGPFAAINKRMSQQAALPTTIAVSAQAIRGQRVATVSGTPTINMQEIGTVVTTAATTQAAGRSALQTTVASSLTTGQLTTQKLAAITPGSSTSLTAIQPLARANLTPQQINILRQAQVTRAGTSSIRTQKILATADQLRAQQLKHPQQKQVITQQLLVPVRGQSILQSSIRVPAKIDDTLQALRMKGQITAQGKRLQTAQIVQSQSSASSSQPVALVKSVSASPSVSVPVTIPVSSISVGPQRAVVASRATTVNQLQQQRMILTQRKAGTQQKVTGTAKAGQIPLIIPQHGKLLAGNHILQHIGLVKNQPGGIQQIITNTSQPTIITHVSQGQPITQMVAKVSLTSGNQTITAGTPITVTHVNTSSSQSVGLSLAGGSALKTATITSLEPASVSGLQVHSVQPGQKTVVGLTQSLVSAQTVQVQQASSGSTSFLQVTPATVTNQSGQQATVTVPAGLVAAMRADARSNTPTQISLVATTTSAQSAISTVQIQSTNQSTAAETVVTTSLTTTTQPTVVATMVTQTTQASTDSGQKVTTQYSMRTRNAKH